MQNENTVMIRSRTLGAWLLWSAICSLLLSSTSVHAQAQPQQWPTFEFVIVGADPTSVVPLAVNPLAGFSGDDALVVAAFEKYLGEVAPFYQGMGFASPRLPLVAGKNGGKAWLVHLYDYADNRDRAVVQFRGDMSAFLEVDRSRAIVGSKGTDQAYEDLAHELFHAIQRGYQTTYDADHGNWIAEGQAQAVGMAAAAKLRGIDVNKGKNDDYRLGRREYFLPLPTETNDEDYRTASFWRYLGEENSGSKTPNYSYLVTLYSVPFSGPKSVAADLLWLDEGLRKLTDENLANNYAHFATAFAGYVPSRLTAPLSAAPEAAHDKWLKLTYGECPMGSLTERSPTSIVRARLQKNSARCFKADVNVDAADLIIQANSTTIGGLESLWLGTSGSTTASAPDIARASDGDGYVGTWSFRVPKDTTQVFVVSNVAKVPTTTEEQDVQFTLLTSMARMTSSAAGLADLVGGPINLRLDRIIQREIVGVSQEAQLRAGIDKPCMLRLNMEESKSHAGILIAMDNQGPIKPGTFNADKAGTPVEAPGRFIASISFGWGSDRVSYKVESGTLELTAFSESLLQGKATLFGRLPNRGYGNKKSPRPETVTVQTEFTVIPRVNVGSSYFKTNFCFDADDEG